MGVAIIAAAGITAVAVFFFFAEGDRLADAHARVRTQILNTARWAIVIALSWALIPAAFSEPGPQRGATILGLAGLLGAVILIPVRWFVQLGGLEPTWELRRVKVDVARAANRIRRDRGAVPPGRLRELIDRVGVLRTLETAELCDLMVAELNDLLAGAESWNEAGRRAIRMDEIGRLLWPGAMPEPDYDPDEATFRWHLYRTFGRMMEVSGRDAPPGERADFRKLAAELEQFGRPDTQDFVDAVRRSASCWLASPSASAPWIASFNFEALGPDGLAEIRRIWSRDAALWGARLDEDDHLAIAQDLARRAGSIAPAPESSAAPVNEAT
jgi:hypothetical protein